MCLFFAETKANTVHGTHSRVNFPNFIRGEESGDNKNSDDPLLSFPPTRILLPSIPLPPSHPHPHRHFHGFPKLVSMVQFHAAGRGGLEERADGGGRGARDGLERQLS